MDPKQTGPTKAGRPPHNRRLGLCGVSLTDSRLNRNTVVAAESVRDEIENILETSGYFENAPFWWVTVAIRYGMNYDDKPRYQPINKEYGDLPLAIEVNTCDLVDAPFQALTEIFRRAVLVSLIDAGHKYGLPVERLEQVLAGDATA